MYTLNFLSMHHVSDWSLSLVATFPHCSYSTGMEIHLVAQGHVPGVSWAHDRITWLTDVWWQECSQTTFSLSWIQAAVPVHASIYNQYWSYYKLQTFKCRTTKISQKLLKAQKSQGSLWAHDEYTTQVQVCKPFNHMLNTRAKDFPRVFNTWSQL